VNTEAGGVVGLRMTIIPRSLLALVLFLATACTYYESADDMPRAIATPEQWGQEKVFKKGTFIEGKPQVVLTRDQSLKKLDDPGAEITGNPQTSTILCGVDNLDSDSFQDYILRWVLRPGVGGARTEVRFDATRFTRISLPLEAFTLGLLLESLDPGNPDFPDGDVTAFAFVGEGGIGSGDIEGAIFTQFFTVPAVSDAEFLIPTGATAWRMIGISSASFGNPFLTSTFVRVQRGISVISDHEGRGTLAADPSLLTLFASGQYLPLSGSSTQMHIINGDVSSILGYFQYKLDL